MTEREIKPNLNRMVVDTRSGIKYMLAGGIIHRDKRTGAYWYQAQLRDLSAESCEVVCRLEDVEVVR